MKKLQRFQAAADEAWGFDFSLWDQLGQDQLSLPGLMNELHERRLDAKIRRAEYIALALAGEVGELANALKKVRRQLLQGESSSPECWDGVREEAADVLAYLLKLCNLFGWDLEDTYVAKMHDNEVRFGVIHDKAKGRIRGRSSE